MRIRDLKASEGNLKASTQHSQSAQRIYALLWGLAILRLPEGNLKAISKHSQTEMKAPQRIYALLWGLAILRLPEGNLKAISKHSQTEMKAPQQIESTFWYRSDSDRYLLSFRCLRCYLGAGSRAQERHDSGPREQQRRQTTRRNAKTKPKWDQVKSKLSRIRSESDRIGKVLRFEGAHGPLGLRAPSTTLLCSRPVLLY